MLDFSFYSPTEFVFGRNTEAKTGELARQFGAKKVMILYGGGSAVKSGLIGRVQAALDAAGIKYLTPEFESLGFKVLPTQGNFICVHIGAKAKDLVLFLEQNGMIVRGLTSFGLPEHIRVTLGKREENELLVSLVKKWKAEN